MYKTTTNSFGQNVIIKTQGEVMTSFLEDPANTDAQEFAKWLQDGNIPEAAEEGGSVSSEWVAETIAKLLPNG